MQMSYNNRTQSDGRPEKKPANVRLSGDSC